MSLRYGDTIEFVNARPVKLDKIMNVVPIKYHSLDEQWVVCEQKKATHMLIVANISMDINNDMDRKVEYIVIEIGKCENLYLLADAIVD